MEAFLTPFLPRTWSGADPAEAERRGPVFYVSIYAAVRRYSMNMHCLVVLTGFQVTMTGMPISWETYPEAHLA